MTNRLYFKTASYIEGKELIKLKFPFDLEAVRQIKANFDSRSRDFHGKGKDKYWTIPLTIDSCIKLKRMGYKFSKELKDWINEEYFRKRTIRKTFKIEGLKGTLFKYQEEGVRFVEENNGRALIADEMGLGKTIQGLGYIQLHKEEAPAIIVCPASVKYNWEAEANDWLEEPRVTVLSGKNGHNTEYLNNYNVIILNFDIVHHWIDVLRALQPKILIIDEIHYIKNDGTKKQPVRRTKAVKRLANGIPKLIGLSGTPIENKPVELYNIIHMINPRLFPNKWHYQHRYCDPKNNGFGWTFDGATNTKELHDILKDRVMIRRMKKDVLPDLPDKLYSFIPIELDNKRLYKRAETDFIKYIKRTTADEIFEQLEDSNLKALSVDEEMLEDLIQQRVDNANPLTHVEVLKQLSALGKINGIMDWINDFLESGKKLVLFCEHLEIIDMLMKQYKGKIIKIDGRTPVNRRKQIVDAFQTQKKYKIFVGNKAAETGITLTAASDVGIIEYPPKPGSLAQRIDRCHRVTQTETVNVYYFMGMDTIDMKLAKMLDYKQKMINSVLDGKADMGGNLIMNLINSYK